MVELVRGALRDHGMRVAGEMDVSARLGRALGLSLEPCMVLFVMPWPSALREERIHPWAAAYLPLHVVISGGQRFSEVHIQNIIRPREGVAFPGVYDAVMDVQRRVSKAVEAVAARASIMA